MDVLVPVRWAGLGAGGRSSAAGVEARAGGREFAAGDLGGRAFAAGDRGAAERDELGGGDSAGG